MTIGLKKFSTRVAVFIGGTLTVAAYLITAFTSDIRVFYFAQGGLGGITFLFIYHFTLKQFTYKDKNYNN
jgi:pseudouridine-5'-phosphate glycosidase